MSLGWQDGVVVSEPIERSVHLSEGPIRYLLRRTKRARGLRATIDPRLGLVVSLPPPNRRGWADPESLVGDFLRTREAWLRRHLERRRTLLAAVLERGPLRDGVQLRYRGVPHRLVVEDGWPGRSSVALIPVPTAADGEADVIRVRLGLGDRRGLAGVLRDWCRAEARAAIASAIERHRRELEVVPKGVTIRDPRTRWGSASRQGRLSFSWRLVLAPPPALETVVVHELAHLRVFGHGPAFWVLVAARVPDHAVWRRWLRDHALELHAAFEDPTRFAPFG